MISIFICWKRAGSVWVDWMRTMSHMLQKQFTLPSLLSQINYKCILQFAKKNPHAPKYFSSNNNCHNATFTLCVNLFCAITLHFVQCTLKWMRSFFCPWKRRKKQSLRSILLIDSTIITKILHFNEFPLNWR